MNSAIQQMKKLFPEIFPAALETDRFAPYKVLSHFGSYCAQHFEEEKAREILAAVNKIYQRNDLFACNAIENEFFSALATQLDLTDLNNQLKRMPESLWGVYIKVLLETKKVT